MCFNAPLVMIEAIADSTSRAVLIPAGEEKDFSPVDTHAWAM